MSETDQPGQGFVAMPHFEWHVTFSHTGSRSHFEHPESYTSALVHTRASRQITPGSVLLRAALKCRHGQEAPPIHKWREAPRYRWSYPNGFDTWAFSHRDGDYAEVQLWDRNVEIMVSE